jgi:hypothetical protein
MNDNIGVGPGLVLFTRRVVSAVGRLDIDLDMLFIIYMIFTLYLHQTPVISRLAFWSRRATLSSTTIGSRFHPPVFSDECRRSMQLIKCQYHLK